MKQPVPAPLVRDVACVRPPAAPKALIVLGLASLLAFAPQARAVCDVIPGPTNQFRAAVGAADRPFAGPGEFVDMKVRPEVCDRASSGIKDVASPSGIGPEDAVVTVVFTPPGSGARHAVVTATGCATLAQATCVGGLAPGTPCTGDLQCLPAGTCSGPSRLDTCQAQLGPGGSASCVAATGPDLFVSASAAEARVRFRFPDTDALVGTASDDRTLAGPATLVASAPNQPLPCGVATQRCAETGGTIACVDELYAIDGTCATTAASLDETFPRFTALPPPNNYEAVCSTPGTPCDGTATEVRFTTDAGGNVLIPMDYRGVLVRLDDVPVPRLVRGETDVDAFAGGAVTPVSIPDPVNFLASYSPQGRRVPPLFTPLADPNAPASLTLFGSVDAPQGVIRIARKGPGTLTCSGGSNAGNACTADAQCPGAECALFDFRDRYDAGVGPVVLPDTLYAVGAESPVPIDGLNETEDLFAFVRSEALTNEDLNGDGDQTDPVLTLRDRTTGAEQAIGAAGSPGRAATRIRELPFTYPAVATEGDVVAYLEPEPLQGSCIPASICDANGNGDVFDTILRVYRLGIPDELTTTIGTLSADAGPVIDGRSLTISDELVFFRTAEASQALQKTERVSVASDGSEGDRDSIASPNKSWLSNDGRFVSFGSGSTNLVPGDTNEVLDIFLRDRLLGTTERVSLAADGSQASSGPGRTSGSSPNSEWTATTSVSDDGRFVVFQSTAPNLVPDDTNLASDVFVRDRTLGMTERIAPQCAGLPGTGTETEAFAPTLSPDGRLVAFSCLSESGLSGWFVPLLYDRALSAWSALWSFGGLPSSTFASWQISADRRFVGLTKYGNPLAGVFVSQAPNPETQGTRLPAESVSRTSLGQPSSAAFDVSFSADGRLVGFTGTDASFTPGDTNGGPDVFVRDRAGGTTERVSAAEYGQQGPEYSLAPSLSRDGRYVAFYGFVGGNAHPFVTDRVTGLMKRADPSTAGAFAGGGPPSLSGDGRYVSFSSAAADLVVGDSNGKKDIFVRGPDPTDCEIDLTGDCDLADDVLRVLDSRGPMPTITVLGAARRASVVEGDVVFVGGDGSVRLWRNRQPGPPIELELTADEVAMSASWIAALVSESHGAVDLNGDGDLLDRVVFVNPAATASAGGWTNVGMAAEGVSVSESHVAFLTTEKAQGLQDLNGNGSFGQDGERVLHVYDPSTATLSNLGQAEDFVLSGEILAFRSYENWAVANENPPPAEGIGNRDTDYDDSVMRVYDFSTSTLRDTQQAAVPCQLEACDPRMPYRVSHATVTFLTFEQEQGEQDLNGDGDALDILVQTFNARSANVTDATAALSTVASASAGICSDTGLACGGATECASGLCFVPPGACVLKLSTGCDPSIPVTGYPAGPNTCPAGQFCRTTAGAPLGGYCHQREGACRTTGECSGAAVCEDVGQEIQRIPAPVGAAEMAAGELLVASAGVCVEPSSAPCSAHSDCSTGEFCRYGTCARNHGGCVSNADCAAGTCEKDQIITATAADVDGDGLADPIDNCREWPNAAQADADADGIGDLCDAQTCGNGVREGDPTQTLGTIEECDDGNLTAGDGCDAACQREAQDCADGFDNDGDGLADMADSGCNLVQMASERPACSNGLDDDADGQIDYPADAQCQGLFDPNEGVHASTCGLLGPEPLGLYALLVLARRRRRRQDRAARP